MQTVFGRATNLIACMWAVCGCVLQLSEGRGILFYCRNADYFKMCCGVALLDLYRVVLTTRTAVLYLLPAPHTPGPGMMTAPGLHCSTPAHTTFPRLATAGAHCTPSAPVITSRPTQLTALLAPKPPPTRGRQSTLRVLKPALLTPKEETTPKPAPAPPVLTAHLPPIPDRDRHSPTVPPPLTTAAREKQVPCHSRSSSSPAHKETYKLKREGRG